MDTKHIHCMLEKISEYGKCMMEEATGNGNVNLDDAGKIVDMVKDLACAEKDALIAKEMRKAHEEDESEEKYFLKMLKEEKEEEYKKMKEEYGEDEGERRFYDNYRYTNGRFAPKGRGTYRGRGGRRGYEETPYTMTPEMYHMYPAEYYRDMDRMDGKMYYSGGGQSSNGGNMSGGNMGVSQSSGTRGYEEGYSDGNRRGYEEGYSQGSRSGQRDGREGRSGMSRRTYMETKEMHADNSPESKQKKMRELEKYMGELSTDLTEMIAGASNEEKTMLKTKLQTLTQKIQ